MHGFFQVLGNGFEVISVGKRKLVRSVPTELNKDHNEILELAQVLLFLIFLRTALLNPTSFSLLCSSTSDVDAYACSEQHFAKFWYINR